MYNLDYQPRFTGQGLLDDDPRGMKKHKGLGARLARNATTLFVGVLLLVAAGGWLHTHKHRSKVKEHLDATLQTLSTSHAEKGTLKRQLAERDQAVRRKEQEMQQLRTRLDRLTAELGATHDKGSRASAKLEQDLLNCQGELAVVNNRLAESLRGQEQYLKQMQDTQTRLEAETHARVQLDQQRINELAALRSELNNCRVASGVGVGAGAGGAAAGAGAGAGAQQAVHPPVVQQPVDAVAQAQQQAAAAAQAVQAAQAQQQAAQAAQAAAQAAQAAQAAAAQQQANQAAQAAAAAAQQQQQQANQGVGAAQGGAGAGAAQQAAQQQAAAQQASAGGAQQQQQQQQQPAANLDERRKTMKQKLQEARERRRQHKLSQLEQALGHEAGGEAIEQVPERP